MMIWLIFTRTTLCHLKKRVQVKVLGDKIRDGNRFKGEEYGIKCAETGANSTLPPALVLDESIILGLV